MKTQIKRYGTSNVIILSREFMKFKDLQVGDWLDMNDVVKVKEEQNDKESTK